MSSSTGVSPIIKQQKDQQNCTACSERGFVTKTATPRFPHKEAPPPPPPPKVCHGCVERSAILEEVGGLREMVHTLSSAMMELHERVSIQKQRIADLESELLDQKRHSASQAVKQAHPEPSITSASHPQASSHSTQVSGLLEKMLGNNLPAMEARILSTIRRAEMEHNSAEFKQIREELQRKSYELSEEFHRSISKLQATVGANDKSAREAIGTMDKKLRRSFHQLCGAQGFAVPSACAAETSVRVGNVSATSATSQGLATNVANFEAGGGGVFGNSLMGRSDSMSTSMEGTHNNNNSNANNRLF